MGYDINYKKKPNKLLFYPILYTRFILFKAQEYLYLTIFEKPMIHIYGKTILSLEFKSMIKAYGLNPWQFIYLNPNSHWQYQSAIPISNIKAQFSSAISKAQLTLTLLKTQANYMALFIKSSWLSILGKILISFKSPIMNNTLDS